MDIALTYDLETRTFDIGIANGDLVADDTLETAIVLSIFTDRRADADDVLPGGSNDRRGWWGDSYADIQADRIGSRLWLRAPGKQLRQAANLIRSDVDESLAWLVDDRIAARVENDTVFESRAVVFNVRAQQPGHVQPFERQFQYVWEIN